MVLAALDLVARVVHILGVLIWIGHNYVNVVQTPRFVAPALVDTRAVSEVFVSAMKREHGIFRWSSVAVWITGLYMLWYRDILLEAITLSGPHAVIGMGAWTGTLMLVNLWLVMWPHQKRVLGFVPASEAERLRCARITFLSSRMNTVLSVATLFFMVAGAHAPYLPA
jgi:hypothetical protein